MSIRKKALVIEVHPYHFFLIPGSVRYLEELGFIADILTRENKDADDILLNANVNNKRYLFDDLNVRQILSGICVEKYDFIFLTSLEYFHDNLKESALNFFRFPVAVRDKIAGIQHHPELIKELGHEWMAEQGRIFVLSDVTWNNIKLKRFIPFFLGNFYIRNTNNRNIMTVGNSGNRYYISRLIDYIRKNCKDIEYQIHMIGAVPRYMFLKWVKYLFRHYAGTVIYSNKNKYYRNICSFKSMKSIHLFGRLDYPSMYAELQKQSFILIGMDPLTQDNFYKGLTTGSLLLAYSFGKPCILEEHFAEAYGLDASMAVIFRDSEMDGIKKAVYMDDEAYVQLVNNFAKKADEAERESVFNLKTLLVRMNICE